MVHSFMCKHDLDTEMYKAMQTGDMADAVKVALVAINMIRIPLFNKTKKSELASEHFRIEGNQAYKDKKYQKALILYNKAILHAPTGSQSMILAYSNRSALLLTTKAYFFCLKDIETCLTMDCSPTLRDKLHKRKQRVPDVSNPNEDVDSCLSPSNLLDNFFKFKTGCHSQLSSISNEIDFKTESSRRVIAKNNIKVGSVLALDTAFITTVSANNSYTTCHYCSKLSLNLIPCDECCSVLFCSNECKKYCWDEYHSIECKIDYMYNEVFQEQIHRLPLKAALKMKSKCKCWKKMEIASMKMGADRIAESTIEEIYSGENVFNLLNCMDDKHFIHGKMYNASIACAITIIFLEKIPGFFPYATVEKLAAIRAFSRILLFFILYPATTKIIIGTSCFKDWKGELYENVNYGWFPLVSKLRHSCEPNTLAVSLNNKMALIALKPISPGTEITTCYSGYIYDNMIDGKNRKMQLWVVNNIACSCLICSAKWKNIHHNTYTLDHKLFFERLDFEFYKKLTQAGFTYNDSYEALLDIYTHLSKILEQFSDICYSATYIDVYRKFRDCLVHIQASATCNIILDHNE